jgi:hypothetical protein
MTKTETLTWYGGFAGARWNADSRLHLLRDDGSTFCNIKTGLRPVTRRECDVEWCHACNAGAQRVRRDVAAMPDGSQPEPAGRCQ